MNIYLQVIQLRLTTKPIFIRQYVGLGGQLMNIHPHIGWISITFTIIFNENTIVLAGQAVNIYLQDIQLRLTPKPIFV